MSQEKGKNIHEEEPRLTLKNHSPGCMWGIFHNFQHNRWHSVVKRLPRKRHGSRKHTTDRESTRSTPVAAAEVQEDVGSLVVYSPAETKTMEPIPAHKSSMKSRIKALITEEMYRRKGRHRRSTSCPPRNDTSIHTHDQEKSSDAELPAEDSTSIEIPNSRDSVHSTALSKPFLPNGGEEHNNSSNSSCDLCDTMLKVNYLKQSEVNKLGKQPVRDHTVVHGNLVYAIEPSKRYSLQESKLYMDALDLLNVRQEMFMRILQDPNSSLAYQLHYRRTPNLRFGLNKCVSFPASRSSDRRDLKSESSGVKDDIELRNYMKEHSAILTSSVTENGSPEHFPRELELSDNTSPNMLRKRNENKVVLKGFKTIREKIKYVIRDRKKEKNRIVMDAVHHKVPYGHTVSNKSNDDGSENKPGLGQMGSDFGKSPLKSFKRTSSFNESLDRYNQLLEISSNREAKDTISERSSSKTAETPAPIQKSRPTLGRILSLPDLRSYSSFHIDDSSLQSSDSKVAAGNINVTSISINEHKPLRLDSINKVQICYTSESESQENLIDFGETLDETADLKTLDDSADSKTSYFGETLNESGSPHDLILELMPSSAPQPSLLDQVLENDFKYQEDEIISQELEVSVSEDTIFVEEDSSTIQQDIITQNTVTIDTQENELQQFYKHLLRIQVDTTNEPEFNYVKEILELSGFSSNEIIGKWHPLVFEEIEGCLIDHQDCCANEEDRMCNHLLLFDLINEVLLDIHERSFSYWPTPLTGRCHIHQLPKGGYHVLEGVWSDIKWLLSWKPENEQAIDDAVTRDLGKHDDWMNLQSDAECVGIELEDMIFDDLLDEITSPR